MIFFSILSIAVILILSATVLFLGYLLLKLQKQTNRQKMLPPPPSQKCPNHREEGVKGVCAICEKKFCEKCLRTAEEGPTFCLEHIKTFLNTSWAEIGRTRTTPDNPDAAAHLYKAKREFLKKHSFPCFISTSYKIDVQNDQIDSFVSLCIPKEQRIKALEKISPPQNVSIKG